MIGIIAGVCISASVFFTVTSLHASVLPYNTDGYKSGVISDTIIHKDLNNNLHVIRGTVSQVNGNNFLLMSTARKILLTTDSNTKYIPSTQKQVIVGEKLACIVKRIGTKNYVEILKHIGQARSRIEKHVKPSTSTGSSTNYI